MIALRWKTRKSKMSREGKLRDVKIEYLKAGDVLLADVTSFAHSNRVVETWLNFNVDPKKEDMRYRYTGWRTKRVKAILELLVAGYLGGEVIKDD